MAPSYEKRTQGAFLHVAQMPLAFPWAIHGKTFAVLNFEGI
jgi:hypothetical protein